MGQHQPGDLQGLSSVSAASGIKSLQRMLAADTALPPLAAEQAAVLTFYLKFPLSRESQQNLAKKYNQWDARDLGLDSSLHWGVAL